MRIAVVGTSSGSGKTTLSRRLAALLGVPHVELDALYHGPGWVPADDFEDKVDTTIAAPGWVVDGNYFGRLGDRVISRADIVVWLDLPLRTCLSRLARRTAIRLWGREVLWNGNREGLRSSVLARNGLFLFTIRTHSARMRKWPVRLAPFKSVRLRSEQQVADWFEEFRQSQSETIS